MRAISADQPVSLQVEGYRTQNTVTGGIVLAPRPAPDSPLCLPPGERHATMEWSVDILRPDVALAGDVSLSPGLASRWATVFACFRPEYGGFSNNASSVNCHVSVPTEANRQLGIGDKCCNVKSLTAVAVFTGVGEIAVSNAASLLSSPKFRTKWLMAGKPAKC